MLVLSQYRNASTYDDLVGERYHFPKRYRSRILDGSSPFIYYEPRSGGDQAYFGAGWISNVVEDTEDEGHYYADISGYREFPHLVSYFAGPDGAAWEDSTQMQWSVRVMDAERAHQLLVAGGIDVGAFLGAGPTDTASSPFLARLQHELDDLRAKARSSLSPPRAILRKVRMTLETYERPSNVTNWLKTSRGSTCQLCGYPGFLKRDGRHYCEVHHLFHLSKFPLEAMLQPEYLVVLCASCHRRMHYADVSDPVATRSGWMIEIDGAPVYFETGRVSPTDN